MKAKKPTKFDRIKEATVLFQTQIRSKSEAEKLLLLRKLLLEESLLIPESVRDIELTLDQYKTRHLKSELSRISDKFQGKEVRDILKKVGLNYLKSELKDAHQSLAYKYYRLISLAIENMDPGVNEEALSYLEFRTEHMKSVRAYRKRFK